MTVFRGHMILGFFGHASVKDSTGNWDKKLHSGMGFSVKNTVWCSSENYLILRVYSFILKLFILRSSNHRLFFPPWQASPCWPLKRRQVQGISAPASLFTPRGRVRLLETVLWKWSMPLPLMTHHLPKETHPDMSKLPLLDLNNFEYFFEALH